MRFYRTKQLAVAVAGAMGGILLARVNGQCSGGTSVCGEWGDVTDLRVNYTPSGDPSVPSAFIDSTTGLPRKVQAIHTLVLHNGKVLLVDYEHFDNTPVVLFDPSTGYVRYVGITYNQNMIFCSGHTMDASGRAFFSGGDVGGCPGETYTAVYVPSIAGGVGQFVDSPKEHWPISPGGSDKETHRWYPTCTTLHDGNILVSGGWCGFCGPPLHFACNPCPNAIALCDADCPANNCNSENPGCCMDVCCYDAVWYGNGNVPAILHTDGDPADWSWEPLYCAEVLTHNSSNGMQCPDAGWNIEVPAYPFMFQAPDAVFYAGSHYTDASSGHYLQRVTRKLFADTQSWSSFPADETPTPIKGHSAVMYQKYKVMKAGGGTVMGTSNDHCESTIVTDQAIAIDLNAESPQWTSLASMPHKRIHFYLVALPSGQILATGGSTGAEDGTHICSAQYKVLEPDLYDPHDDTWTTLAPMGVARMYHSTALLLPDGSVFTGGGEDSETYGDDNQTTYPRTYQIFKPPYFFQGTRPAICAGPQQIHYGGTFNVTLSTHDASEITKLRLIHPGGSTHSFDSAQRSMELSFSVAPYSADTLCVSAPASGPEAPPGHYMLFVAKGTNGSLPSTAHWLRLTAAGSGSATITGADPPTANPYCPGTPFRDVLQTGSATGGTALTQGVGGSGTPAEGPYDYAPITVTFSAALSPALTAADITVNCSYLGKPACSTECPRVTAVSGSNPYSVTLSGPIPPGGRTELTFVTAASGQVLAYDSLPGDASMDGLSNSQDLSALLQALNNGTANLPENLARYDIDRNGSVNTQDYLREAQLLNGRYTTQVWDGATVTGCLDLSCLEGSGGSAPQAAGGESGEGYTLADAQLVAALQAACAEYGVELGECQQMIDDIFGAQP